MQPSNQSNFVLKNLHPKLQEAQDDLIKDQSDQRKITLVEAMLILIISAKKMGWYSVIKS